MKLSVVSVTLGDSGVASVILGQSPPSSAYNEVGDGLPFFQGKVDFRRLHPIPRVWCTGGRKFAEPGDILISVRAPVGDVNVATEQSAIGRGLAAVRPGPDSDPWFLYFALLYSKPTLEAMATGSTFASINRTTLNGLNIPFFDRLTQVAIGRFLRSLVYRIEQEDETLRTAQALKRAAMRTLFTRGLRDEPQKETGIGPVPESWKQTTLGNLCDGPKGTIQTGPFGSQLHKDDYQETGVPVVNPTHLNAGRIDHKNVPRISDENAHRLERHRLYVNDIVLARRGQIGRMARVTESEEGWLCGTGSFLIRARQPFVDNRFLYFQLSTEPIVAWLTAHAAGAIMPNLNNMVLRQIPVFFPSVDEQTDIVAILDAIDRKIDLYHRKRVVLEDLFKALLHELMTGEIRVGELGLAELKES